MRVLIGCEETYMRRGHWTALNPATGRFQPAYSRRQAQRYRDMGWSMHWVSGDETAGTSLDALFREHGATRWTWADRIIWAAPVVLVVAVVVAVAWTA